MQIETVIYVLLGGLAGGFVNGLAGMGTSLFALGFFLWCWTRFRRSP